MAQYIWLPSAAFKIMLGKPLTLKTTETLWDKPLTWFCALTHVAGNAFGSLATRLCFFGNAVLVQKRCQVALWSFGLLIIICRWKSLIKAKKLKAGSSLRNSSSLSATKGPVASSPHLISSNPWNCSCEHQTSSFYRCWMLWISGALRFTTRGKPLKSPLQSLLPGFSHSLIPYPELGKNAISSAPSTCVTWPTSTWW